MAALVFTTHHSDRMHTFGYNLPCNLRHSPRAETEFMAQKSSLLEYISSTVFRTSGCHAIFSG